MPLSKLLGQFKSNAGIASQEIRLLTISALDKVSVFVGSTVGEVVSALKCLQTFDSHHVGEYNFEVVFPTLNRRRYQLRSVLLGLAFSTNMANGVPLPLLLHCLHVLCSSDRVLSRRAFEALEIFVLVASKDSTTNSVESKTSTQSFLRVLESL